MNFGDLPLEFSSRDSAAIRILPVPYDGTSTWGKGADKGPQAILDASAHMELYDIETGTEVYRRGIYTAPPVACTDDPESMADAVQGAMASALEAGAFPVLLGGEHSVSIGAFRAAATQYRDLTILQLDAHTDLRREYDGSRYNHACVMSHARSLSPIVQVGIRSMDRGELPAVERERIFYAHELDAGDDWMERAVNQLSQSVYITVDLDVFDPSVMPSTGTPEPGGLQWPRVMQLLEKVAQSTRIVGFDVVELCPNEFDRAPDFLAAKLVYRLLSMVFCRCDE
jgi:agmatinase